MSTVGGAPACVRCGYLLVGFPPPIRCPECGHMPRVREPWRESELHLEGPGMVLPVLVRHLTAALLLTMAMLCSLLMGGSMNRFLGITLTMDPQWAALPVPVVLPVVAWLWSRPLTMPGTDWLHLDAGSRWRAALPFMQLGCWAMVPLMIMAILGNQVVASQPATQAPQGEAWRIAAMRVGIVAQIPWILALRHEGRTATFLRDEVPARMALVWGWCWMVALLLQPVTLAWRWRFMQLPGFTQTIESLFHVTVLGYLVGVVMAWLMVWRLAASLTLAHETMDRDARRAERERNRYRIPD
ncbi:MAG: hypothetical protein ACO32J_00225 [Phycisphaerales bacterium]